MPPPPLIVSRWEQYACDPEHGPVDLAHRQIRPSYLFSSRLEDESNVKRDPSLDLDPWSDCLRVRYGMQAMVDDCNYSDSHQLTKTWLRDKYPKDSLAAERKCPVHAIGCRMLHLRPLTSSIHMVQIASISLIICMELFCLRTPHKLISLLVFRHFLAIL